MQRFFKYQTRNLTRDLACNLGCGLILSAALVACPGGTKSIVITDAPPERLGGIVDPAEILKFGLQGFE